MINPASAHVFLLSTGVPTLSHLYATYQWSSKRPLGLEVDSVRHSPLGAHLPLSYSDTERGLGGSPYLTVSRWTSKRQTESPHRLNWEGIFVTCSRISIELYAQVSTRFLALGPRPWACESIFVGIWRIALSSTGPTPVISYPGIQWQYSSAFECCSFSEELSHKTPSSPSFVCMTRIFVPSVAESNQIPGIHLKFENPHSYLHV